MDTPGAPAWPESNLDLTLQYKVHLGLWTDWSRGRVLGATLTLDRQQANLLIAFTASFVVLVGSRFWHIICLFLHQIYSTSDPRDTLHHQRQVVLRNSGTSDAGVFKFVALLHAWRRSSFKSIVRIAPALLLAVLCTIGFTVAGGFSSQIQFGSDNIGSAVLLDGINCSVITNVSSTIGQLSYERLSANSINAASNYAQQCYSANSTGLTDCNYFVSRRLPGFIDSAAPCPFKDSLCRSNSTNLALDTGFINTDAHLGLNAPPEERLFIRHKLQCAPLVTKGHSSVHGNHTRYNYGSQWALIDPESDFSEGYLNYTYAVESLEDQYRVLDDATAIEQSYMLRPLFSGTVNGTPGADPNSGFVPSEELGRPDADVFLVFLSGHGVFFSEPLHDEWYRATEPYGSMREMQHEDIPIYRASEAASPLACASQWQFCNTNTSTCGPTASYHDAMVGAAQAFGVNGNGSTEIRSPATDRLGWLMQSTGVQFSGEDSILLNLQDSALLSKQSLMQGYQGHLPDNQWQLDVTHWFSIYLALIQSNLLQTASGFQEAASGVSAAKPMTEAAQSLCSNQKIRTTRYSSFSFFGILFTYILGCLVLITSYSLEPVLACLHRRRMYKQYAYLEWMTNDTLQLHRVAHEGQNSTDGTWSGCTSWVPTTAPGVLLSSLDISDLKHPRLPSKDQDSITPSLDDSEDDDIPPEAMGPGDSNPGPDFSSAQQPEITHEAVNTDTDSTQMLTHHMTTVALAPVDDHQLAQVPIHSQAIGPPSALEETPFHHVPDSTMQTRPEQISQLDRRKPLPPLPFPLIVTERKMVSMSSGDSATSIHNLG